jgi:hypothetical protein
MPRIRPVSNLREYFRQSVAASLQRNEVEVNLETSGYVGDLLTLYARSEALFEQGESGPELKPVALVLAAAADRGRAERYRALQRVGDQSLFIAGFLGDSLARKLVDVDYYVSMGGSAYRALSAAGQSTLRERARAVVFAELARNFLEFVDVLADLREVACDANEDLLRLYETWTRTGSRRAARRLRAHGIEPQAELRAPRKPH